MALAAELFATGLVKAVGQLENLMKIESEQYKQIHIEAQVFLAMTKIVFDVIPLILECVETFVLDFPPAPSAFHHDFNIFFI